MTRQQELDMHDLAVKLANLTASTNGGWSAMQYMAIAKLMNQLAAYCAPEQFYQADKGRIART